MNVSEVIRTLEALASGVDPSTGSEVEDDSVVLQQSVHAALATALGILRSQYLEPPDWDPVRSGAPWLPGEDAVLKSEHERGLTPRAIAEAHLRTEGSVLSRLAKLGLVSLALGADEADEPEEDSDYDVEYEFEPGEDEDWGEPDPAYESHEADLTEDWSDSYDDRESDDYLDDYYP